MHLNVDTEYLSQIQIIFLQLHLTKEIVLCIQGRIYYIIVYSTITIHLFSKLINVHVYCISLAWLAE